MSSACSPCGWGRIGAAADLLLRASTDAAAAVSWDDGRMRRPTSQAPIAAWSVAAASLALVAWAVPVAVHDGLTWKMFVHQDIGFSMVLVATMPILGAFVLTRDPGNRLGWLLCLYGPLRGVEILADVWVRHDYGAPSGSWPGGPLATWVLLAGPFFLLPTTVLITLWFPDGHAPQGRWRRLEIAPMVMAVLLAVILIVSWPYRGPRLLPDPPLIHGWRS